MGRDKGFEFIQLNTNGLRLAREPGYAAALRQAGLASVFLQFDGVDDAVYRALRGADLWEDKQRAVERCGEAGLGVVLVPTLAPGVNDNALGDILRFALSSGPHVRGVHFQPVSYFGRYPGTPDNDARMTLPEIMRALEDQTRGLARVEHFRPPGCEHALCSFHGNYLRTAQGGLIPLGRPHESGCCAPAPPGRGGGHPVQGLHGPAMGRAPGLLLPGPGPGPHPGAVRGPGPRLDVQRVGHGLPGRLEPGPGAAPGLLHPRGVAGRKAGALLRLQPHFHARQAPAPGPGGCMSPLTLPRSPLDSWMARRMGQGPMPLDPARLRAWQLNALRELVARAVARSPFYFERLGPRAGRIPGPHGRSGRAALHHPPRHPRPGAAHALRVPGPRGAGHDHAQLRDHGQTQAGPLFRRGPGSHHGLLPPRQCRPWWTRGRPCSSCCPGPRRTAPATCCNGPWGAWAPGAWCTAWSATPAPPWPGPWKRRRPAWWASPSRPWPWPGWRRHEGRDFRPHSVLLTSDYVPGSVRRELERVWDCRVFSHWGTVETGLGGGVECRALDGAHTARDRPAAGGGGARLGPRAAGR